jgi:hypothetical protein
MRPATVEYAKGWGYEVTFPGEAEPVEVAETDVESEFARRHAVEELSPPDADAAKRHIAAEIATARLAARLRRR